MTDLTAPSGAKVVINIADFDESMALKAAIARQIKDIDLAKELKAMLGSKDIMKLDVALAASNFLPLMAAIDSSEDVQAAVFKCLARCSYNGEKIIKQTFGPTAARQDYYPVVLACLKENLAPFFEGLRSLFDTLKTPAAEQVADVQK